MLTPAVAEAIDEIKTAHPGTTITVTEDGEGGAWVVVDAVDLGPLYKDRTSWIGFQITFQYPYSDVYPLFVRPNLERVDGQALGEGFGQVPFQGQPAVQVSRRSNRLDPAHDTAALKLTKVLEWIRTQ